MALVDLLTIAVAIALGNRYRALHIQPGDTMNNQEAPSQGSVPTNPSMPAPQQQPGESKPDATSSPATSSPSGPVPTTPALRAAKAVGLYVILGVVTFWNIYCLTSVVPQIDQRLREHGIPLNDHQTAFVEIAARTSQQPMFRAIPVAVLVLLGLACLLTRLWDLFSGMFFGLIVILFLMFLYGWMVFAVTLIQIKYSQPPSSPNYPGRIEVVTPSSR
jgi:hypothetical protein